MTLHERVVLFRNKKGLTQEELAELTNVNVRTIQRLESGQTTPRPFTLKAIATALDVPFEELYIERSTSTETPVAVLSIESISENTNRHFLQTLCLSCFSFLLIPLIHFLIPAYLLKKQSALSQQGLQFGRKVVRTQVIWVIALNLLLLLTLAFNLLQAAYLDQRYPVSYLWPFLGMYLLNPILIGRQLAQARQLPLS
jgi:transcriptional regulator with XRE-family HTH domain